jgi:hypothetical protein
MVSRPRPGSIQHLYAGHSLRRGLLTAGAENQAQLADLMRQPHYRSARSVLGYIEPADLWRDNAIAGLFGGARPEQGRGRDGGKCRSDVSSGRSIRTTGAN